MSGDLGHGARLEELGLRDDFDEIFGTSSGAYVVAAFASRQGVGAATVTGRMLNALVDRANPSLGGALRRRLRRAADTGTAAVHAAFATR